MGFLSGITNVGKGLASAGLNSLGTIADTATNVVSGGHGTDLSDWDNKIGNGVSDLIGNGVSTAKGFAPKAQEFLGDTYNDLTGETDRRFSSDEAEKQRNWEDDMRKRTHQDETADLLKAGLNPVQSAGGAGNLPSGASAHPSNVASATQGTISSGLSLLMGYANAKNVMSQADVNTANASRIRAMLPSDLRNSGSQNDLYIAQALAELEHRQALIQSGRLSESQAAVQRKEIGHIQAKIGLLNAQSKLTDTQRQHSALGLTKAREEAKYFGTNAGKSSIFGEHLINSAKGAVPWRLEEDRQSGRNRGVSGSWIPSKKKGGK